MPEESSSDRSLDLPGEDRLDRLEEAVGFVDRTVEQLSAEIAEMNTRVRARISGWRLWRRGFGRWNRRRKGKGSERGVKR